MRSEFLSLLPLFSCFVCRGIEAFSVIPPTRAPHRAPDMSAANQQPSKSSDDVPSALVEHAVAWAATNGLGMVVNDDKDLYTSTHLPFSLLPYGECLPSSLLESNFEDGFWSCLPFQMKITGPLSNSRRTV